MRTLYSTLTITAILIALAGMLVVHMEHANRAEMAAQFEEIFGVSPDSPGGNGVVVNHKIRDLQAAYEEAEETHERTTQECLRIESSPAQDLCLEIVAGWREEARRPLQRAVEVAEYYNFSQPKVRELLKN